MADFLGDPTHRGLEPSAQQESLSLLAQLVPERALKPPPYVERYDIHFRPIRTEVKALLELGIHDGGSLEMWRDYFENATVVGLDVRKVRLDDASRIHMYTGFQQDLELLDRIARERAPDGFDIIIDDCSHEGFPTKCSFWKLFDNHLKPGGIFVIEDWGTGYWDVWPDGRRFQQRRDREIRFSDATKPTSLFPSHQLGIPGFVKQLVDECAIGDITSPTHSSSTYTSSHGLVKRIEISRGQAFIFKGP